MKTSEIEKAIAAIENFIVQREKKLKSSNYTSYKDSIDGNKWTLTQMHIVSLIKNNPTRVNNAFLAKSLGISRPAVSKAIHTLIEKNMIIAEKKISNQKATYYALTDSGHKLSIIHDKLHQTAKERYSKLLDQFSESELKVIIRFLDAWSGQIIQGGKDNE